MLPPTVKYLKKGNSLAVDRMANCLRVLGSSESTAQSFQDVWLKVCRQSFAGMIKDKLSRTAEELKKEVPNLSISVCQKCCDAPSAIHSLQCERTL